MQTSSRVLVTQKELEPMTAVMGAAAKKKEVKRSSSSVAAKQRNKKHQESEEWSPERFCNLSGHGTHSTTTSWTKKNWQERAAVQVIEKKMLNTYNMIVFLGDLFDCLKPCLSVVAH